MSSMRLFVVSFPRHITLSLYYPPLTVRPSHQRRGFLCMHHLYKFQFYPCFIFALFLLCFYFVFTLLATTTAFPFARRFCFHAGPMRCMPRTRLTACTIYTAPR